MQDASGKRGTRLSVDNLTAHVNSITTENGRVVGTSGHMEAREYILNHLSLTNLKPQTGSGFEITYEINDQVFTNIVGIIEGQTTELPPILLGAHYDTIYGTPGADDNAAAVSILLEIALEIQNHDLDRTLIVCFFDAEEPPHFQQASMGSTRYYEDQRNTEIHCALIMDLVGHEVPINGFEDLLFITGMESQQELSESLLDTTPPQSLRPIPILNSYIGDLSDHHVFRLNNVPYLFMSCGIWSHYHSPTDTADRLNYEKINRIQQYLTRLIIDIDKRSFTGEFEGYDSCTVEAHFINKTVAPLLLSGNVTTRADIDAAVNAIASNFKM